MSNINEGTNDIPVTSPVQTDDYTSETRAMSDDPDEIFGEALAKAGNKWEAVPDKAAARIAELEAERDRLHKLVHDAIEDDEAAARVVKKVAVLAEREATAQMFEKMTWHRISPAEIAAAIRARPAP